MGQHLQGQAQAWPSVDAVDVVAAGIAKAIFAASFRSRTLRSTLSGTDSSSWAWRQPQCQLNPDSSTLAALEALNQGLSYLPMTNFSLQQAGWGPLLSSTLYVANALMDFLC